MPVATEDFQRHIAEPYVESTSLSQSGYDEPWSHCRAATVDNVASETSSWDDQSFNTGATLDFLAMPSPNDQEMRNMLSVQHNSNGAGATHHSVAPLMLNGPLTPPQILRRNSSHQFAHAHVNNMHTSLDELSSPYTQYSNDGSSYQGGASSANTLHDHANKLLQQKDQQSALFQPGPSFHQSWSSDNGGESAGLDVHESFAPDHDAFIGFEATLGNEVKHRTQAIAIKKLSRSNINRQQRRTSDTANGKNAFNTHGQLTLETVKEDGLGNAIHRGGQSKRGIRVGPLPKEQALQIAKTRKEKKVCMKSHESLQILKLLQCAGGLPCQRCQKLLATGVLEPPCLKAQFLDIVEAGSCNYICELKHYALRMSLPLLAAQRAINHLTLDKTRRIQMFLPETFKLDKLLSLLETRRNRYRVKARQQSGPLYTLDLAKCHKFLTAVCAKQGREEFDLRDFIDNKLLGTSEWLDCVSEYRDEDGIVVG